MTVLRSRSLDAQGRQAGFDRRLWLISSAALTWGLASTLPQLLLGDALAVLVVLVTAAFGVVGGLLIFDENTASAGRAMLAACVLAPLNTGVGWDVGPVPFVLGITEGVFWVALCQGILTFQRSPLQWPERVFLGAMWTSFIGGQLTWSIVSRPEWVGLPPDTWWPALVPDLDASTAVQGILGLLNVASAIVFCVLIGWRASALARLDHRHSSPVAIAAAVSAIGAAVAWTITGRVTVIDQALLLGVPLAFAVSVLRARLLRAELGTALAGLAHGAGPDAVEALLQELLRDDTTTVYFWVTERSLYVGRDGRPVDSANEGAGRMRLPVATSDGEPVAVVTTDAALRSQRQYLETVVSAVRPTLENARLQATVRAQLAALRDAQARVLDVGLLERRRMERDLHDGAQQRLLSVASSIGLAGVQDDGTERRATLDRAGGDLRVALRELRDLAHGLHPIVLTRDGLSPAIDDVVSRLPLEARLDIDTVRVDPAAEATAYFVICEALTNVAKHAGALRVTVDAHFDGNRLTLEVTDDGVGGADATGYGLQGLVDRVETIGGHVELTSPPMRGTRLTAHIPCR
ncbi:sensor histidine kinase [Actinomycetospora sp. CA-053990]|uniref:sensor histidine kinase n=1 Tax=Actinomycetospora sp. CA-053990 TaxID=3239891 RepID=UPI003D92C23E